MFGLLMLWERIFQQRQEIDQFFMHRAWEDGRMTDAQYRRRGGYLARQYIAEKQARRKQPRSAFRAPAAFGFRSRPFS